MAALLGPLLGKLGLAVAGLVSLLGMFFAVRRSGVQAQRNADLKQSLKNVETANATTATVARLPDAAVTDELRHYFSRD